MINETRKVMRNGQEAYEISFLKRRRSFKDKSVRVKRVLFYGWAFFKKNEQHLDYWRRKCCFCSVYKTFQKNICSGNRVGFMAMNYFSKNIKVPPVEEKIKNFKKRKYRLIQLMIGPIGTFDLFSNIWRYFLYFTTAIKNGFLFLSGALTLLGQVYSR